ncbi:SH3 domain-containing protein [Acetobacteraceae bacterium KSS8]|uniref:SH3 domain-containing protein n=1 Tax=Endosaccharibacter trunci TaxID=2812733 RepID=A0ABT1W9L9_9PROT|nr:SH3 domain-containing protein [Acetobacteraceae bacterium KSS8]
MRDLRSLTRMHHRAALAAATAIGLLAPAAAALAAPGITSENINMRAGPDVAYPLVASLPQGTPVEVYGCLSGWNWCDTQAGGARGWVAGAGLAVMVEAEPEPLIGYGPQIGLPFIGFDFDRYWGHYYRDRPWFSPEDHWHHGPVGGPIGGPGDFRGGRFQGGPIHGGPDIGDPGYRGPWHSGPDGRPPFAGPDGRPLPGGQGGYRPQPGGPEHGGPNGPAPGPGPHP